VALVLAALQGGDDEFFGPLFVPRYEVLSEVEEANHLTFLSEVETSPSRHLSPSYLISQNITYMAHKN
jgi:hypothetical protein